MKLKKYSALICGVLVSAALVACSGGNGTQGQQTLTPTSTTNAIVKSLTASSGTGTTANLREIAKGNGTYVTVGDGGVILTSTDGKSWVSVNSGISTNINAITYNSSTKSFYAVGNNSIVLSSPDGVSWTQYKALMPAENLYSILSVNGDLVIGADDSTIFEIDTNGTGFISVKKTVDDMKLVSATYANGMMLLGSDDGSILYKPANNMGANWNRATKFPNMSINSLSYESTDNWFLAGTSTGKVIRSGNGTVWTTPVTASSSSINSVTLDEQSNYFFAVGSRSGNSAMMISSDYNDWNQQPLPISNVQLNDIKCFDNDCFVVGDNGTIMYSDQRVGDDSLPTWKAIVEDDVTAPTVNMISPMDGANGVSQSQSVQLQFSEPVNNVDPSNVEVHLGGLAGPIVPIDHIIGGDNNIYTIVFRGILAPQRGYIVSVGSNITDNSGNSLMPTLFGFFTGDNFSPTVAMISPANDATNVTRIPVIQFQFSEPVNNVNMNTVTLHSGSPTGSVVAMSNMIYSANNIYYFQPTANLASTTKYYVVISSGVTDNAGNALAETSFSFTTCDVIAPTVVMSSPINNATNVTTIPTIKLQFSEKVNNVTAKTVGLRESSPTGAAVELSAITPLNESDSYVFSSANALKNQTTYYLVIESGVKDLSNNSLVKAQFNFTTRAADIPFLAKTIEVSGGDSICGIDNKGVPYCWGTNYSGQLGNGTTASSTIPLAVILPYDINFFTSMSIGDSSACGIAVGGTSYCWGSNFTGELGVGKTPDSLLYPSSNYPVSNSSIITFSSISVGGSFACGVATDGQSYCWGYNLYGELGNGTTENVLQPTLITLPYDVTSFKSISAGAASACGIANTGKAYCWGNNQSGQLGGNNSGVQSPFPAEVAPPSGVTSSLLFTSISSQYDTTCGIANTGKAYCWGDNKKGTLGNGNSAMLRSNIPVAVTLPSGVTSFTSITTGGQSACGIGNNGLPYCWGVINGATVPTAVKLPNDGVTSFTAISLGSTTACGIGNTGQVYCWGSINNSSVPVAVMR